MSDRPPHGAGATLPEVTVWDPLVRVGHWALVVLFFVAYVTEEELLTLHVWAGYGIGGYLAVRLVWGVIGTRYARFSDFAYGPAAALRYLLRLFAFRAPRHLGHSPAGGFMVFVLLGALAATTVSGTALLAVEENAGPLAPWLGRRAAVEAGTIPLGTEISPAMADEEKGEEEHQEMDGRGRGDATSEWLKDLHEVLANLTAALVVAHVVGVALASIVHRENLVRAMITGRKRAVSENGAPPTGSGAGTAGPKVQF